VGKLNAIVNVVKIAVKGKIAVCRYPISAVRQ
jgi:hypothetical protein